MSWRDYLRGAASVFDLWPQPMRVQSNEDAWAHDRRVIAGDWRKVAQDLADAFERVRS